MRSKIKGRIITVDDTTQEIVNNLGVWGAKLPNKIGEKLNSTLIDIISDMLNMSIGDYIILWKSASKESGESKFYGVYRIISKPYIESEKFYFEDEDTTQYPFRVRLETAYSFKEPINEYDFINDINIKNDIWTIIGKKIKGKGRASIPITENIISIFIKKFINVNTDWSYNQWNVEREVDVQDKKIELSLDKCETSEQFLDNYNINCIPTVDNKMKNVKVELVLYAIFNQYINNELEGNTKSNILESLGIKNVCIDWYANYLPYGIEGKEIDFMISTSADGLNTSNIKVIEFQKNVIDEDHIERVCKYTKWSNITLCKDTNLSEAIIIGPRIPKSKNIYTIASKYKEIYSIRKIEFYIYEINDKVLRIKKILEV